MIPRILVAIGCAFFLLGLGYLHQPRFMERVNAFIRDYLLNDSYIALNRRKWGTFFLLWALLLIYLGYIGMERFR